MATDSTIRLLTAKRPGIEAGTEWGPPAIKPLVLPNIGIATATAFYVGDIKVELRPVKIHSDDGLVIYLPADRILLAGDTLEDTVTFISEPEHVAEHYRNMRELKDRNIDRILPNHGNPDVISRGGYQATLIDATLDYLGKVIEDYVGGSVTKGWVSIWWAYREAHERNLKKVAQALGNEPLPELPK
jgi:glyoxylase-like metal-dependent hydrolase (beta-lactamase superfamily II)